MCGIIVISGMFYTNFDQTISFLVMGESSKTSGNLFLVEKLFPAQKPKSAALGDFNRKVK